MCNSSCKRVGLWKTARFSSLDLNPEALNQKEEERRTLGTLKAKRPAERRRIEPRANADVREVEPPARGRGEVATHGGGPTLTKIGRTVRYRKADVLAWLEAKSRRIERTSELADRG